NAARNHVSFHIWQGSVDLPATQKKQYRFVIANILAHVILDLLPQITSVLEPGGYLLLSGILEEQGLEIDSACQKQGLEFLDSKDQDGWIATLYRLVKKS